MVDIIEKLNSKFDNKFNYLKLLSVVLDENKKLCTITFLYPITIDEISKEDKALISQYLTEFLLLKSEVKIKFKKSFLDKKLILNDAIEFFKTNKKALIPYLNEENFSIERDQLNIKIKISLNQDVYSLINEQQLKNELVKYLNSLYIANFDISIEENDEVLPDEIDAPDIITLPVGVNRYDVQIIKKIVGTDILPKPEYIKNNKSVKQSVILAGILSNKVHKTYTLKKGKRAGEERSLFTFSLKDVSGDIDCIYFAAKTYLKDMEALPDGSFVLCLGDIAKDLYGKVIYRIKKLSLANMLSETISEKTYDENSYKPVVIPTIVPRNTQENIFEVKPQYDSFILNNDIVVFDIETTGLDPDVCEITEIGAVKISHGEITEQFSSLVKPKSPIPLEVQNLTNITNEMVADAPRIENVIRDFYNWTRGCLLSGYNVVGFDMKFIIKAANKVGLKFTNEVIDTMIVVRQSTLRVSNYKLATVVKALNMTLTGAHRAYNDAYATAKVLMEMHKVKKVENK